MIGTTPKFVSDDESDLFENLNTGTQLMNSADAKGTVPGSAGAKDTTTSSTDAKSTDPSSTGTKDTPVPTSTGITDTSALSSMGTNDCAVPAISDAKDTTVPPSAIIKDSAVTLSAGTKDVPASTIIKDTVVPSSAISKDVVVLSSAISKDVVVLSSDGTKGAAVPASTGVKDTTVHTSAIIKDTVVPSSITTKGAVVPSSTGTNDGAVTAISDAKVPPSTITKDVAVPASTIVKGDVVPSSTGMKDDVVPSSTGTKDTTVPTSTEITDTSAPSSARTKDVAYPSSTGIKDDVVPSSTTTKGAVVPSSTGINVVPSSTGMKDDVVPLSTGMKDDVVPSSTGTKGAVVPSSTGMKDAVVPSSTGTKGAVVPSSTGMKDAVVPSSTGTKDTVVRSSTGTKDAVVPSSTETRDAAPLSQTSYNMKDILIHKDISTINRYRGNTVKFHEGTKGSEAKDIPLNKQRNKHESAILSGNVGGSAIKKLSETECSIRIQSAWRGKCQRKQLKRFNILATSIQKIYRGKLVREQFQADIVRIRDKNASNKDRNIRLAQIRSKQKDLTILSNIPAEHFLDFERLRRDRAAKSIQRMYRYKKQLSVPNKVVFDRAEYSNDARKLPVSYKKRIHSQPQDDKTEHGDKPLHSTSYPKSAKNQVTEQIDRLSEYMESSLLKSFEDETKNQMLAGSKSSKRGWLTGDLKEDKYKIEVDALGLAQLHRRVRDEAIVRVRKREQQIKNTGFRPSTTTTAAAPFRWGARRNYEDLMEAQIQASIVLDEHRYTMPHLQSRQKARHQSLGNRHHHYDCLTYHQ